MAGMDFSKISEKFKGFSSSLTGKLKGSNGKVDLSKVEIKIPDFREIVSKLNPKNRRSNLISREINLVPDVKEEMIRALKMRNFIFFLCIVIASASVAVTLVFASIAGGQQAIVDGKKTTLTALSKKVNDYSDLSDFLTIKDQLSNIELITENKTLLSRTFSILSALLPKGADTITISELTVNLAGDNPTLAFDAQANAGDPPYIDYNVLDSFKKSMQYMRYDYGTYVDKEGEAIPAYCMIENGTDGATFSDPDKGYYAYWLILGDGCNPSYEPEVDDDGNEIYDETEATEGYTLEEYDGNQVVKIWRTPQFDEWYGGVSTGTTTNVSRPFMDDTGAIENVAHFESECISYYADENEDGTVTWGSENSCVLVPDGVDGIVISDSSNGRGSSGDLVLRFSAVITLEAEAYSFSNHHLMAVAPTGRYNVTDSYKQVQNMFGERATDCAIGDTACYNNSNGGN